MTDLAETIARWNVEDAEDDLRERQSALRKAYIVLGDVAPDVTRAILRAYHATSRPARDLAKQRITQYRRMLGLRED